MLLTSFLLHTARHCCYFGVTEEVNRKVWGSKQWLRQMCEFLTCRVMNLSDDFASMNIFVKLIILFL